MADRQTPEDKALAMREYRKDHDAAVKRIDSLRAARLARDAAEPAAAPEAKAKRKPRGKAAAAKA